jgi:hypothetical protein
MRTRSETGTDAMSLRPMPVSILIREQPERVHRWTASHIVASRGVGLVCSGAPDLSSTRWRLPRMNVDPPDTAFGPHPGELLSRVMFTHPASLHADLTTGERRANAGNRVPNLY